MFCVFLPKFLYDSIKKLQFILKKLLLTISIILIRFCRALLFKDLMKTPILLPLNCL